MSFDPKEFNRKLERAVRDTANKAVGGIAGGLQQALDQVYAAREGKSVEQLQAALSANVRRRHLTLPDENLKAYAQAIAEGRRVKVEVSRRL
jgi:hypothetical protein